MTYVDNRGDQFHLENEKYLRERIKALEAKVEELERQLSSSTNQVPADIPKARYYRRDISE
jgi:BMFP domain-containing protein YqiC